MSPERACSICRLTATSGELADGRSKTLGFDLDEAGARQALERLEAALKDVTIAADLLWNSVSVMARFEQTGAITPEQCQEIGLVGVAARACGVERDVRHEFP
jgi:Ni,Fe-hydrogenase III large subunit